MTEWNRIRTYLLRSLKLRRQKLDEMHDHRKRYGPCLYDQESVEQQKKKVVQTARQLIDHIKNRK